MFQRHQYVVHGVSVCILDTRQPRCLGSATVLKDADRKCVFKTFWGLSCCIEKVNLYFRCSTNLDLIKLSRTGWRAMTEHIPSFISPRNPNRCLATRWFPCTETLSRFTLRLYTTSSTVFVLAQLCFGCFSLSRVCEFHFRVCWV